MNSGLNKMYNIAAESKAGRIFNEEIKRKTATRTISPSAIFLL
jgi:hypothetical protein